MRVQPKLVKHVQKRSGGVKISWSSKLCTLYWWGYITRCYNITPGSIVFGENLKVNTCNIHASHGSCFHQPDEKDWRDKDTNALNISNKIPTMVWPCSAAVEMPRHVSAEPIVDDLENGRGVLDTIFLYRRSQCGDSWIRMTNCGTQKEEEVRPYLSVVAQLSSWCLSVCIHQT